MFCGAQYFRYLFDCYSQMIKELNVYKIAILCLDAADI